MPRFGGQLRCLEERHVQLGFVNKRTEPLPRTTSGEVTLATLAAAVPNEWEPLSGGECGKGSLVYDWPRMPRRSRRESG